jgi:hypothetical protein
LQLLIEFTSVASLYLRGIFIQERRAFSCEQWLTGAVMSAKSGIPLSLQHMLTKSVTPVFAGVTEETERKCFIELY